MIQDYTEIWLKLVEELVNGIDNGDFSDYKFIPSKYRWEHLEALYYLKDFLEGGADLYKKIYDVVVDAGVYKVKEKIRSGYKLNVLFQSYSAAQWPAENVYRKIEQCEDCNVQLLVSPLVSNDKESYTDTYKQTYTWFKSQGYKVFGGLNLENEKIYSWEDIENYPDILYQVSSWYESLPIGQQLIKLPLTVPVLYIPYGIYLANNKSGDYVKNYVYNKQIINMAYRVYCACIDNFNGFKNNQFICGKNVRYSGYAKMDYFYNAKNLDEIDIEKIWCIPEGKKASEVKRIIIAPHHSIVDDNIVAFSTFHQNLWFLLFLAKKYSNEISFIFKPHPSLRKVAVSKGLFDSYEDYDDYILKWDSLPNARVVQESDYLEYFATSDAMIMDSCSFVAEYMYTKKPLLFLTRPEQRFLTIGEKALETYYKVSGTDYFGIEDFINNVVLNGNDYLAQKRNEIFECEFDYVKLNGVLASEYIYKDFENLIK